MHNSHRSLRNINLMISASMKRPRLCFFIIFFCQQRQKKMKDRRVRGCKKESLRVEFRIFCYSAKNARKKAKQGPALHPLRSRRPFMAVGVLFFLQTRRRWKMASIGWWVVFYPLFSFLHHGYVVGVWLFRGVEAPPPTKR